MQTIKLNNGIEMPDIGFGTWKAPESDVTTRAVEAALQNGHRLIDCAAVYGNEKEVGRGLIGSGVPRQDIFLVSKLWNSVRGYKETRQAFENSCRDLQTDYLDLYLIHWPRPFRFHDDYIEQNRASWRAMEDLVQEGRIRAIGVSNFKEHHLRELMEDARILPAVNQIEFHPSCLQEDIRSFCAEQHIAVQGYSTLANGQVFHCEELLAISREQNISLSRLCTQYARQRDVVPLVKSVDPARIRENLQLDFCLSPAVLEQIDRVTGCAGSGNDSDAISF